MFCGKAICAQVDEVGVVDHLHIVELILALLPDNRRWQGCMLLVEHQRFKFEDAKTHLIELASLQHSLDPVLITEKAEELERVCSEVNAELDELERGLEWRYRALAPIWIFAVLFAAVLYAKYEQLMKAYVRPCED